MAIEAFRGKYRFLSNFWYAGIVFEGMYFRSAEHAYQAAKSLDPVDRLSIQDVKTPGQAKRLGRTLTLRPDWEEVKLQVMETIVRDKFSVPYLRKLLLETDDEELIEGNHWGDTFWGVCRGEGENHLGKILMKIRKEIHGPDEEGSGESSH